MKQGIDFKAFDQPIAIFRAGKNKDSAGVEHDWTADDLDELIDTPNPDGTPFVVGHPETDAPAFGWVGRLYRDGDTLYAADHQQMNPDFVAAVDAGSYKNRSVGIGFNADGKMYLRHIGFLGAAAPAIKGMPTNFNDGDQKPLLIEFSDSDLATAARSTRWSIDVIARWFRRIKNKMIEDVGLEEAEKEMPEYEWETLREAADQLRDVPADKQGHFMSHSSLQNIYEDPMNNGQQPAAPNQGGDQGDAVTFSEEEVQAREKAAAEKAEKAAEARIEKRNKARAFADDLEQQGVILPAQVPHLAQFLESQSDTITLTFSEGEGDDAQQVEKSQFDMAMAFFSAFPKQFAELKTKQADSAEAPEQDDEADAVTLAKKAQDYQDQ